MDTYHRGIVRRKESTLGRKHTHYSAEFRAEAVRLAETSGESIRQIAHDLGISNESLRRRIALARERGQHTGVILRSVALSGGVWAGPDLH